MLNLQVIILKISFCLSALTYFSVGVYCFYTNYSFSFNIIKSFDKQCRYFVLLFVFAAFDLSCRFVKTMTNFDYTEKLKYVYKIKNVNLRKVEKHKLVKKSIKFINF